MTPDCDWVCVDTHDEPQDDCFAVWIHCDCCETQVPDGISPAYNGGLVALGNGLPIDKCEGGLWFDDRDILRGIFDVCVVCTGSGGGYVCGFHDKDAGCKGR